MLLLGETAMNYHMQKLSLVALVLAFATSGACAEEKIFYGSRAGMQVTVVSSSGLDTQNAVIKTAHTREDATAYCRDYVGEVTEDCIKKEMARKLADSISANCPRGIFTNFWGGKVQFKGKNPEKDAPVNYILVDMKTGEVADGSGASDYDVNMQIFKALCPKRAPADG